MNQDFIDLYNEELRFLREAGQYFADAYPQVAGKLGMHEDTVSDPFVERLLEGVSFLTARIQSRLDVEHAEFARQMLARVAPLWDEATPSIATLAFTPDFASPECQGGITIEKGSVIQARLPGNKSVLRFTTGQAVQLLPLEISKVRCAATINHLPPRIAAQSQEAAGVIALEFSCQGRAKLGELKTDYLELTLAGDIPLCHAIQKRLMHDAFKVFAWAEDSGALEYIEISKEALSIIGVSPGESLLPASASMLPGLRLLREYFAQPSRFLGVRISGLSKLFKRIGEHRKFHIGFLLRSEPANIVNRINAQCFRLFATPVINLYPKTFDPIVYNPDRTDQWVLVDRLRPLAYDIHHITECRAILENGRCLGLAQVPPRNGYAQTAHEGYFSSRKQYVTYGSVDKGSLKNQLPIRHFVNIGMGPETGVPEDVKSLQIDGYVSDRGWYREHLDQAGFSLTSSSQIGKIECLRLPSEARDEPLPERHWEAVQLLGSNPLRMRSRDDNDLLNALHLWLGLAADPAVLADQRRIGSIDRGRNKMGFSRSPVPGPMSWVRSNRLRFNVDTKHHPDGGAWLFSRIVCHALLDCVNLNDGLEVEIDFDGESGDVFSNLSRAGGRA